MASALFTHPDCRRHVMAGHPERPERLLGVMQRLNASGLLGQVTEVLAEEAGSDSLRQIHPDSFVTAIARKEPVSGLNRIEADTYMSTGSMRAARLAAGAGIQAVTAILEARFDNAFCAVRPPGHHAEIAQAMGFCLFNNIAIAAQTALLDPEIERVAIFDFDVHHCNGTVDIFKDRPEVLVCSSFQENFYPHRYLDYSNEHIIISPLAAGTEGKEFRSRVERQWIPAVSAHKPDMILISAGFDAHRDDPLGQLRWDISDYRWITGLILELANEHCKGRVVSMLEGGYDIDALASSVQTHVEMLCQGHA